jgi:hypothetical protein
MNCVCCVFRQLHFIDRTVTFLLKFLIRNYAGHFRGAVKIWKPKVTPMSELAPSELKLLPESVTDGDRYVQKTSLAADKPVIKLNFEDCSSCLFPLLLLKQDDVVTRHGTSLSVLHGRYRQVIL